MNDGALIPLSAEYVLNNFDIFIEKGAIEDFISFFNFFLVSSWIVLRLLSKWLWTFENDIISSFSFSLIKAKHFLDVLYSTHLKNLDLWLFFFVN